MAEYIEKEKAARILREEAAAHYPTPYHVGLLAAARAIESIPAADVRPVVKAEWYGEGDGYADGELVYDMWSCPICGKRFEEWEEKPDWNYCPNCGARMEES